MHIYIYPLLNMNIYSLKSFQWINAAWELIWKLIWNWMWLLVYLMYSCFKHTNMSRFVYGGHQFMDLDVITKYVSSLVRCPAQNNNVWIYMDNVFPNPCKTIFSELLNVWQQSKRRTHKSFVFGISFFQRICPAQKILRRV